MKKILGACVFLVVAVASPVFMTAGCDYCGDVAPTRLTEADLNAKMLELSVHNILELDTGAPVEVEFSGGMVIAELEPQRSACEAARGFSFVQSAHADCIGPTLSAAVRGHLTVYDWSSGERGHVLLDAPVMQGHMTAYGDDRIESYYVTFGERSVQGGLLYSFAISNDAEVDHLYAEIDLGDGQTRNLDFSYGQEQYSPDDSDDEDMSVVD